MHFTISIDIDADAESVWATMIDIERWPEWTASVTSVNRLDSGPFGQDSRARVVQPRLPAAVWQVTRFEPNVAFAWVSKRGGVRTEGFHGVRPREGGGSTAEVALIQTGPLAWLIGLFYGRLTRRYVGMEAEGLKRVCEAA